MEVSSGAGAVSGDIRREATAGRCVGRATEGEQVQGGRNARHLSLQPGVRQRRPTAEIRGETQLSSSLLSMALITITQP